MYISIKTSSRNELVDITTQIQARVTASGIRDGLCFVYCPHTTAAVTINESADPAVKHDMLLTLSDVFPNNPAYKHLEGNSDAHVKSSVIGASEVVAIENGQLVLGTWQGIFFCEFDGPRTRKIFLRIS